MAVTRRISGDAPLDLREVSSAEPEQLSLF
jgi:hypothetical protein